MATVMPKKDVVIVGAGWTGGIVAAEAAKAGLSVVALERGKDRSTADFSMVHDELRYALRYDLMQNLSRETVTFRNNESMRALPMRQHGSFLLGEGVGGAGVHWNGMTHLFLDYDFQIYTKTVERYGKNKIPEGMTLQDWGITEEELDPYFYKFVEMAGISGSDHPLRPRSWKYPTPPMKLPPALQLFYDTTKAMGYNPFLGGSANLSQSYTNSDGITRAACEYCGFCERFGCEYGAKADPTVTVLPVAQRTGNFELRPYSHVLEILHDGKKARGVRYVNVLTNEEFEQPAEIVVLCGYVFTNVKLLLVSKLGTPYDPKTGRGVIGKNYCYQVGSMGATGFFENKEFNTFMGAGALSVSLDDLNGDYFDHSNLDFLHGGMISLSQTGRRPIANNAVPPGTPSWGKEFKAASIKYFNRYLSIGCQGASLPWRHHYLDLDPIYKDRWGQPLVRITFDFEDQDRNMVKYIAEKIAEIMKEMGADIVVPGGNLGPYNIVPYQSTHNTGGAIMGADPKTSAVNKYSQMWEAENVFVLGASSFAHNGGANPTGTVGALAYLAAEGIIKYSKNPGILV